MESVKEGFPSAWEEEGKKEGGWNKNQFILISKYNNDIQCSQASINCLDRPVILIKKQIAAQGGGKTYSGLPKGLEGKEKFGPVSANTYI